MYALENSFGKEEIFHKIIVGLNPVFQKPSRTPYIPQKITWLSKYHKILNLIDLSNEFTYSKQRPTGSQLL